MNSTPLLQDWLGDDKAKRNRREIHFPSGRFGEAVEQAQAVLFLASDESSFVNAQDFVVDGGLTKVSNLFRAMLTFHMTWSSATLLITLQAYVTPEGPATAAPQNFAAGRNAWA
jgi:hypothetical protein